MTKDWTMEKITIVKKDVMAEVSMTSAYTAAKIEGSDVKEATERIATVDEDDTQLERFWQETLTEIVEKFKHEVGLTSFNAAGDFVLELELSPSFDRNLLPGMSVNLNSYAVLSILARWFTLTNKKEVAEAATRSVHA